MIRVYVHGARSLSGFKRLLCLPTTLFVGYIYPAPASVSLPIGKPSYGTLSACMNAGIKPALNRTGSGDAAALILVDIKNSNTKSAMVVVCYVCAALCV